MSKTHTPGPWHAGTAPCGTRVGLMGAGIHPVAMLGMKAALSPADVRLIEAAPDLLEVCEILLARLEREGTGARETWAAIEAARTLIAKVKGEG